MSKYLLMTASAIAILACATFMLGIWADDGRWMATCGALSTLGGVALVGGLFALIGEAP